MREGRIGVAPSLSDGGGGNRSLFVNRHTEDIILIGVSYIFKRKLCPIRKKLCPEKIGTASSGEGHNG